MIESRHPSLVLEVEHCYSREDIERINGRSVAELDWRDYQVVFAFEGCAVAPADAVWFVEPSSGCISKHSSGPCRRRGESDVVA